MLTGRLILEARKLLNWSPNNLARRASLRPTIIERAEREDGEASITTAHAAALKQAFTKAGIRFHKDEDGTVMLRTERVEVAEETS